MKSTTIALASASLLAMAQSHVLAQYEDIPETVLVTGSLIRGTARVGVPVTNQSPLPSPDTLTQLTSKELRAILPGASFSTESFECDGTWSSQGVFLARGVYSVRGNQYCIAPEAGASPSHCGRLFRDQEGNVFAPTGIELKRPTQACGTSSNRR